MKYILCFFFGVASCYLLSTFINYSTVDVDSTSVITTSSVSSPNNATTTPVIIPTIKNSDKLIASEKIISIKEHAISTTKVNSSTEKSLSAKVVELKAEIQQLKQKYQTINNKLMEVTMEKEALDESSISDVQMLDLKNDEFSQFRRQYKGKQRDDLYDFHQQEDDLDWGYRMSIHISDFIQTHHNSNLVALEGVTCKIDSCELLVSESESGGWPSIMRQMRSQSWWIFTSTQSSSRFGENKKNLYYLYLSN